MVSLLTFTCLLCFFVIAYVYIGYPIILWILNLLGLAKAHQKKPFSPKVAMLICCYNEVDVINEKIANCMLLDYPKEKLDLYFISDGSDDGTDEIIQRQLTGRLHYLRQEGRLGKTSALNMAIEQIESEIIVFSDANAMYKSNAITELVANFYDSSVGYVVGAALYMDEGDNSSASSEQSYWQYELAIKVMESKLHSVVGGDGAIYAIRKELYKPLDKQDINDFVNPLQIIESGFRGVFDPEAVCYEYTSGNFKAEGERKQRIVNRSFTALWKMKVLLNPFKFGFYSFSLISHKFLRWLVFAFFIVGFILSYILATLKFPIFTWIFYLNTAFILFAIIGSLNQKKHQQSALFYYPFYFFLVNIQAFIGVIKALSGKVQITWQPHREKIYPISKGVNSTLLVYAIPTILILMVINLYLSV